MKIKNISLIILISSIHIQASGPLLMKGFHHDIPFDRACKIMSTFKSERGNFIPSNKKEKKCGFGRNGLISYPYITGSKDSDKVDMIVLSPDVVNHLFEAETLNSNKFSKAFLRNYDWIDTYQPTRKYHQESMEYGWKLSINRKKWMKITFFDTNTNNDQEGKK